MIKKVAEQGNFMVLGRSGSGKTLFCAQVVQALLSEQHPNGGGELRKSIQKNDNNSGEHHDNQQ